MISKIWKDPVWSKVIATLILTLIAALGTYFLHWWPIILNAFQNSIAFLSNKTEVTNWLLCLMILCTIVIIFALGAIIWINILPTKTKSGWNNYTTDIFFELEWHWHYGSGGQIYGLYSCCPHCHYQVYPEDVYLDYERERGIKYHCDSCGKRIGPIKETKYSVENKVERFIQQKLRTNQWDAEQKK